MTTVHISADYINRFSDVTIEPSIERIANGFYEVELEDMTAEEMRLVTAELKAWKYGRHNGQIIVSTEGASDITIPIYTFIFP